MRWTWRSSCHGARTAKPASSAWDVQGHGAAADAADQALGLELVQVAADRHLGDAEAFGEFGEGQAAASADQSQGEVESIRHRHAPNLTSTSQISQVDVR